jgi:hypothetical protein
MRLLATICAVVLLSYSALALDKAQKKPEQAAPSIKEVPVPQKDPNADKPKPSAEIKKLSRLLGRWQAEEKYEVTPFTPQGGEGKGLEVIRRGPGGLSIVMNYKSTGTMGDYSGTGIVTWSPEQNTYLEFWVDNGAAGGELWAGKWEGETLVFTNTQKMGGQTVHWKQTISGMGTDAFTLALDMGQSDSDMKRFMTYKFARTAKQTARIRRHGTGMHGRPNPDNGWAPRAEVVLRAAPRL